LKELETKVDDLEKASDSANHENSLLRAQVERLQTELKEYRKRLSLGANPIRTSPQASSHALSPKTNWDINNNFQFAFPKFGPLGTDPNAINGSHRSNGESVTSPTSISRSNSGQQTTFAGSTDDLSDLFSPSVLAGINSTSGSMSNKPRTKKHNSETNTASPCSSAAHSSSNGGFISSSATTPEFSPESPEQRKASEAAGDTQRRGSTTHETFCKNFQTACGNKQNPVPAMMSESDTSPASASSMGNLPNTPGFDTSSFDWIANQNGGGFDPVLFGDYRDPQDNIMNNDFAFFDNAFAMPDFDHSATTTQPIEPVLPKKKDLMQQIEESQADKDNEVVPGENAKQFLTCNMLWLVHTRHTIYVSINKLQGSCTTLAKGPIWGSRHGRSLLSAQV
jgi:AP-1-like factor